MKILIFDVGSSCLRKAMVLGMVLRREEQEAERLPCRRGNTSTRNILLKGRL